MNSRYVPPTVPGAPTPSLAVDFTIHAGDVVWVFDGDSITAGHPDVSYRWQAPMETSVSGVYTGAGKTAPTYNNVAVGGRTSTDTLTNIATATAFKPTVYIILSSVNDEFNHGGTPIPPATTASNYVAIFAAVLAASPGCRIHVLSNLFDTGENWPDGANTEDPTTIAMNTAIQGAVSGCKLAIYHNVRTVIFGTDAPVNNPTHLTSGVLTQDGTHPTKTLGQTVWSTRVQALLSFLMT